MSPLAIGLVLIGACAHATWSLAAKRASAVTDPLSFMWCVSLVSTIVLTPLALWQLMVEPPALAALLLACGVAAVIHTCYFFTLQSGYARGDVSILYPMARGLGPLLSMTGAMLLFGERPAPLQLFGALMLIAGVLFISLVGGRGARLSPTATFFGIATSAAIACYTLWDANAVTRLGINPMVQMWGTSIGMVLLVSAPVLAQRDRLRSVARQSRSAILIAGTLSPVAYISVLFALQLAPASLVAPSREVSVVFVSLAGWLIFKERHPVPRLIGAVVVVLGVALIAVG